MKKKRATLSKAEFLAKMAAGRAAAALRRGELAAGSLMRGGRPATRKRKNAGPNSTRKTKKFLKSKGHKIASGSSATAKALARLHRANAGASFRKLKKKLKKQGRSSAQLSQLKKNIRKVSRRRNPEEEAAERFEYFHGPGAEGADQITDVTETIHEHSVLSGIGKLAVLRIKAIDGSGIVKLEKFGGTLVAQDEQGTQLFFKGGNQGVNLRDFGIKTPHESEILGALVSMAYRTDKTHLRPEDGGKAEYNHVFGKNGSRLPLVVYDVRNKLLQLAGGGYDLPEVGIRG
jgi:hypothetical protein